MSAEDRAARDAAIREMARRGEPRSAIASAFGLTTRQVRRVLAGSSRPPAEVADLDVPAIIAIDPLTELGRCVAVHHEAILRLRTLAARSANEAVAAGAAKSAATTSRDLLEVLREAGLTPPAAFDWRSEAEWARAWEVLGRIADEMGIDPDRINTEFHRLSGPSREIELVGLGPANDLAVAA